MFLRQREDTTVRNGVSCEVHSETLKAEVVCLEKVFLRKMNQTGYAVCTDACRGIQCLSTTEPGGGGGEAAILLLLTKCRDRVCAI
jgi:hypothetical protein